MSAHSHSGTVYFAACGKYVKIGYTTMPVEKRLASLPGGVIVPDDLDPNDGIWLLHSIPGCVMRDEARLHGLFHAHRAVGEWFLMTPGFLQHLDALEYVPYKVILLRLRRARAALRRSPSLLAA